MKAIQFQITPQDDYTPRKIYALFDDGSIWRKNLVPEAVATNQDDVWYKVAMPEIAEK